MPLAQRLPPATGMRPPRRIRASPRLPPAAEWAGASAGSDDMSVGGSKAPSEVPVESSIHTSRVDEEDEEEDERPWESEEEGDDWSRVSGERSSRPEYPTQREAKEIAAKKAAPRRAKVSALTGEDAPFPVFGFLRSHDVVLNAAWEVHGRLVVFKWKQMTWGLRMLWAHKGRFKRNPRWYAGMFRREMAAIWGSTGAASQYLAGLHGPSLFR